MTEQWKSVPKKFCDICKCWFYNNKISIEHHENGRRHQECVQQKIRDLGRKGREKEIEDREKYNALMQMERGAMAAYRQDVKRGSTSTAAYNIHLNVAGLSGSRAPMGFQDLVSSAAKKPRFDEANQQDQSASGSSSVQISDLVWYEAKTVDEESGAEMTYYWNMQTGETTWELPAGQSCIALGQQKPIAVDDQQTGAPTKIEPNDGGNISDLDEDEDEEGEAQKATKQKETPVVAKKKPAVKKKETDGKTPRMAINIGGAKKNEKKSDVKSEPIDKEAAEFVDDTEAGKPFGDWQPVEVEEKRKDEFAYLPHNRWVKEQPSAEHEVDEDAYDDDDPKETVTFAERTAPSLAPPSTSSSSAGASISFKKRKAPTERSIRSRDD